MSQDVIVIGGSYAGISAALQLARARRRISVIDAGARRNRFATAAHGFLGQDGRDPAAIAADARAQLLAYPTVTWIDASVSEARPAPDDDGFELVLASGERHAARRLVLASGVVDELPPIPGLAERWGSRVFHCPYCHGYELDRGAIGLLATIPHAAHLAQLLPDWGPTTLFAHGLDFDPDTLAALAARGVTLEPEPVVALEDDPAGVGVRLRDHRVIPLAGLFATPRTRVAGPVAAQLGCQLEDGPTGAYLKVDFMKETTVRGVFACGDNAVPAGSVATAVGDGVRAGVAAHQSILFR